MAKETNKGHWDSLGARYSQNWSGAAQQFLSEKETAFVASQVPRAGGQTVLDVGIGNGRVLEAVVALERVGAVYGVDVSSEMVEFCRTKFAQDPKVRALTVCDVAQEPLPVPPVSFVSAIRVLKYNPNWWDMVHKLLAHVVPGGVLVFTMPNAASVKRFSRPYAIDYFMTTEKELRRRFDGSDGEVVEVTGFSKLPDALYRRATNPGTAGSLLALEQGLDRAVGRASFSRELFVAVRRTT